MLYFKDIVIEGFGSIIKPTTFQLDRGNSLNVIRGEVGSGKTSIPGSLVWCLFGNHVKEKASIETWDELRDDSFKGTKVMVNFSKDGNDYLVIRCKSYKGKITVGPKMKVSGGNNLFLLINGVLWTGEKGKVKTQEEIEKVMGYSFELFKNTIIFGQKMKRIIEETGPNKKKVFEEAFEVGFVNEAKENVIVEKNKLVEALAHVEEEEDRITDKISDRKESLAIAIDNEKNFEKNKKKRLKELQEYLSEVISEIRDQLKEGEISNITNLEESLDNINKLKDKLKSANNHNLRLSSNLDEIKDTESSIKVHQKVLNKKPKKCPTCDLPLSDKGYKNMIASAKSAIQILNDTLRSLKKEVKGKKHIDVAKLEDKLEKLQESYTLQKRKKEEYSRNKQKLANLRDKKKKLQDKIDKVKKETIDIKSDVLKKKIKKLEKEYESSYKIAQGFREALEIKNWLINDPLSNNGLKAYMFDSLLQQVNERLDDYSKILGFQVEFGINLDSHRKDFYQAILKDDIIIPYEDLSGGQAQLVNTSTAFGIHDVVSNIRPTNIMFLDEPFESLGVNEIEIITELVQEKAKNKTLFLITHHLAFNPISVNEIEVSLNEKKQTQIY